MNEGFSFTPCSILIAISQVLIEIHKWEHVVHFPTFSCVPKHVGMNEGFSFTPCSILIAISQVLIEIHKWEHVVLSVMLLLFLEGYCGVIVCVTLMLFQSLHQLCCCCLCNTLVVVVVVSILVLLFP